MPRSVWVGLGPAKGGQLVRATRRLNHLAMRRTLTTRNQSVPVLGTMAALVVSMFPASVLSVTPSPVASTSGQVDQSGISIAVPKPEELVRSPLLIEGTTRGRWFFEGEFPVVLMDSEQRILARGSAKAVGDWMTDQLVSFESKLTFDRPLTRTGELVFTPSRQKDGETGKSFKIPVHFAEECRWVGPTGVAEE